MIVRNKSKHTVLTSDLRIAKSFASQNIGLLAYKKPVALLIPTRWGIHTFFMKYAIDIIVLDKKNTIVKLKENLFPNRIFLWNPLHETILELPEGTIKNSRTTLHDELFFAPQK